LQRELSAKGAALRPKTSMNEVFLEHLVKKQETSADSFFKAVIVLGSIALIYTMLRLGLVFEAVNTLMPFLFVVICVAAYKLFRMIGREFEYTVTNGDLDVDVIIGRNSRKRLFSAGSGDFELLAPYNDANRAAYDNCTADKTIDAASSNKAENRWFCICNTKQYGRVRCLFEPNEAMIEHMRRHIPSKMKLE